MRRTVSALLAAPLFAGALASPAVAAPNGGAQVLRDSGCLSNGSEFNLCFSSMSVLNVTETPSGNMIVVRNHRFKSAGTFLGQQFDDSSRDRSVTLLKEGELHVLSTRSRLVTHPSNFECVEVFVLQLANGEVRQERRSIECHPV